MKMKSLVVVLVCLMATGVYATGSWTAATGYWSDASAWNPAGVPTDTAGQGQIKFAKASTACTLNTNAGDWTTNKVTVGATSASWAVRPILTIADGGYIGINNELQIGDASPKMGSVVQTGGTVATMTTGSKGYIEVGYKSSGVQNGTYTISGGTISGGGKLLVGYSTSAMVGGAGTFTVQGNAASITIGELNVGFESNGGTTVANGTLAFEVNGGVSAINAASVKIDSANNANAIANLLVSLTGSLPVGDIMLINNTGAGVVQGIFDTLNGGSAAEGTALVLGANTYHLTYVGGDGNDVALVIPEPATLSLIALGLLALRKRK
jgi:hypothetical protein